ncbi:MAG: ATP-binding protein [Planctomycetota bacterium]|nr:ATP-binding protein [Planctomycetota bacterium]
MAARKTTGAKRVALKPADPFDLIRLLARSQSDPRKAVCELVQNSLDAGARRIEVTWANEAGVRTLRIWDDGRGVFPELEREDALRRIATTIGHSHKRSLTVQERQREMSLGKYGIGLLGFWSVGRHMEIKSRVAGSETLVLRLEEDRPSGEIAKARGRRIDERETSTEVVIRDVHDVAARQIKPGRLQAYLAGELRGQLLGRDEVEIHIQDRISRGNAHKHFVVRPPRYLGRHLAEFLSLPVPGHEDARLELYLVSAEDDRRSVVQLACGGTTVLDDLAAIAPEEGLRTPWNSGRLEGVVDFPELEVAPSTRRGFVPNAAAAALLEALPRIELQLSAVIHEDESAHAAQKSKTVASEIRRAFRRVALLPEYELMSVRTARASAGTHAGGAGSASDSSPASATPSSAAPDGARLEGAEDCALARDTSLESTTEDGSSIARDAGGAPAASDEGSLFPPGPVARLRVTPPRLRVAPGAQRSIRAVALDADGRPADPEMTWTWRLEGPGELDWHRNEARLSADVEPGTARILVRAESGRDAAEAVIPVEVLAELAGAERAAGIPEPAAVYAPNEAWRSRLVGTSWQFNSGHKDYTSVEDVEARRLRYLVHLFAKEVVLKNFGSPGDAHLLERMVEVLTHLDTDRRGAAR